MSDILVGSIVPLSNQPDPINRHARILSVEETLAARVAVLEAKVTALEAEVASLKAVASTVAGLEKTVKFLYADYDRAQADS